MSTGKGGHKSGCLPGCWKVNDSLNSWALCHSDSGDGHRASWAKRICYCLINVIYTPLLLVFHFVRIYLVPCCIVSAMNCGYNCCCRLLRCCPVSCWMYTDPDFPPDDRSLGNIQAKQRGKIVWVRLQDLVNEKSGKRPVLFDKDIAASDVAQGALGDCWLLAAFATLCERPAFIQNCFLTRAFNPYGKYHIRLYDRKQKRFRRIIIDDFVPCSAASRQPLFSKFDGAELWPQLLEKAVAKLHGSYANIEGGWPLEAMIELTGYHGATFQREHMDDKLFDQLHKFVSRGALCAAGSKGRDNTRSVGRGSVVGSIVPGHAYSILNIKEPWLTTEKIRLLKLRNPWGTFDWKGDWGNDSSLWNTHPGVALEIGKPSHREDGVFYMSYDDFRLHFNAIDVLFPNYGLDNLHYKAFEEDRWCGTLFGCLWGIFTYCCCCRGLCALWCEKSSRELVRELLQQQQQQQQQVGDAESGFVIVRSGVDTQEPYQLVGVGH